MPNGIPQGYNVFFDILQEIQDEGIALPFQPTLNFVGTGVTASDDPGNNRINVTIPGNVQPHNLLDGSQNQDTVANPATAGDLIIGNASPLWDVLPIGTPGQVLTQVGGFPAWVTPTADVDFYQTIEDEGIALAQQPTFNFIGTGVTAVDDPGNNRTNITIPGNVQPHDLLDGVQNQDTVANTVVRGDLIVGNATPLWDVLAIGTSLQQLRVNAGGTDLEYFTPGAGASFYQTIQDEGIALAQEPIFNFIGAGVTAVDDGAGTRTNITIPGTPAHALLDGSQNNDTVANAPTRGSLIYGNATPLWDELLKGTDGQFLRSNATDVLWANIVRADISDFNHNLLSAQHSDTVVNGATEGSIILGNSTPAWDELPIGADTFVLTSDGTTASWQAPASSSFYQTIQDEGIALTQQPTFNFIGAGVTAVNDGGNNRTNITIPGGAGSGAVSFMQQSSNTEEIPDTTTGQRYLALNGQAGDANAEINRQFPMPNACTFARMIINVNDNETETTPTTMRFRVNGADGNQVISIGPGLTGSFQDVVNTDVVSNADLVAYSIIKPSSAGDLEFIGYGVEVRT